VLNDWVTEHLMRVEEIDQLGEVGERARQPVDLVDDDHVDPSRPNIVQELLERRPVWRGLDHFRAYVWSSVVAYNLALFAGLKPA
jgi:hypothetical protein